LERSVLVFCAAHNDGLARSYSADSISDTQEPDGLGSLRAGFKKVSEQVSQSVSQ